MAMSRHEFISKSLLSSGLVAFAARTQAFFQWFDLFAPKLIPEGWQFYESCGDFIFPVYGTNGGISARWLCWLIQKDIATEQWYSIPIEFTCLEIWGNMDAQQAEEFATDKLREAIKKIKPVPINLDGGNMPMPEEG